MLIGLSHEGFVQSVSQAGHHSQDCTVGFTHTYLAIGQPVMVHYLMTFRYQSVAQLGRLDEGDGVADAQRK